VLQTGGLLPFLTVEENIELPCLFNNQDDFQDNIDSLVETLKIKNQLDKKPQFLSGGQRQRVAIARALINQPSIVFADEPSGNLDAKNSAELHDLFFDLRKHFNQTFVIVTHDPILAEKADRKIVIRDGVIE